MFAGFTCVRFWMAPMSFWRDNTCFPLLCLEYINLVGWSKLCHAHSFKFNSFWPGIVFMCQSWHPQILRIGCFVMLTAHQRNRFLRIVISQSEHNTVHDLSFKLHVRVNGILSTDLSVFRVCLHDLFYLFMVSCVGVTRDPFIIVLRYSPISCSAFEM